MKGRCSGDVRQGRRQLPARSGSYRLVFGAAGPRSDHLNVDCASFGFKYYLLFLSAARDQFKYYLLFLSAARDQFNYYLLFLSAARDQFNYDPD